MTSENDDQVVTDLAAAATDRALRAAGSTIGQMPGADLQDKLTQLRRARASRTRREVLRQQAELDSLDLDEAAYTLASQAHVDGNLPEAARWYRIAAANDFADASFRLATVLDALSRTHFTRSDMPEERGLVTEAATWYLAAFLAGDLEGRDPLDTLIARLDAHDDASCTADDDDGPGAYTCESGGLQHVVELQLAEAVTHCHACPPCQAELAKLRPLMGVARGWPAADAPSGDPLPLAPGLSDPVLPARSPQHSGRKGR